MTDQPTDADHLDVVRRYASEALHAAMRKDVATAQTAIDSLVTEGGPNAVPQACLAWADTMLHHVPGPDSADAFVFMDPNTNEVQLLGDGDEDYALRWTARWLSARSRMNETAAEELLVEACQSQRRWTECVLCLLGVVAANLTADRPRITDMGTAVLASLAAEKLS